MSPADPSYRWVVLAAGVVLTSPLLGQLIEHGSYSVGYGYGVGVLAPVAAVMLLGPLERAERPRTVEAVA